MNKKAVKALSLTLSAMFVASACYSLTGCKKKNKKDSIVLMTEELNGLFNPFYATAGTDMDIVGMTQIGMLTTDDNGNTTCGENEATVVLDYEISESNGNSVYTFVLKNDILFSDGYALTMNDVLFNMYEYLDPVYTGSSTMYSTKIEGLDAYRMQANQGSESDTTKQAISLANGRRQELIDIYVEASEKYDPSSTSYNVTEEQMLNFIKEWDATGNYTAAVGDPPEGKDGAAYYRDMLTDDYNRIRELFKKELETDFKTAKDAYDLESDSLPYKKWADDKHFKNDVFKFFYYEGFITPKYEKVNGKDNKNVIESFDNMSLLDRYNSEEKAIEYIYTYYMQQKFDQVLTGWGTSNTIMTEFEAKAKEVLLQDKVTDGLEYPNISGIVSLGHTTDKASVTVNGKEYKVAHNHDETYLNGDAPNKNYGAVTDKSEYDVLQITVEGTDPKAIYNFGFTVAPAHYYTADEQNPNGRKIDIAGNEFGVDWGSFTYQSKVIQSERHVGVPVGAGPFVATDENNKDNPAPAEFYSSNVVYFKKNNNFSSLGEQFEVQAEKLRFQVISSSNALDALASGQVDYVTPQLTTDNSNRLDSLKSEGIESMAGWQLGYGYIGINAGKVPNVYVRRAIMAAMQVELSCEYYKTGTCQPIDWPMSKVGWAYPSNSNNGRPWTQWEEKAENVQNQTYVTTISKIKQLMADGGVSEGDSELKIKFTIAGSSITEHPTYSVFKQAADILNKCGWQVEVVPDSQALVKLSTGSLAVWAAAWGSTVDPDMYQVYSPYSTATSVKAWGYQQILSNSTQYSYEYDILFNRTEGNGSLADIIDEARSTNDREKRKALYQEAMGLVLDLAIELPVYQRQTLYAYNSKTIAGFANCIVNDPTSENNGLVNPYSSPLGRIWELKLVK